MKEKTPIAWFEGAVDAYKREYEELKEAFRKFGDGRVSQFERLLRELKEERKESTNGESP